jgi:transcriptional regulator with XRE-family HTH domain
MAAGHHAANLRRRREALGATGRQMAKGLGIGLDQLLAMENGETPDDRLSFYSAWLSRLEATAPARRQQLFRQAMDGKRFA